MSADMEPHEFTDEDGNPCANIAATIRGYYDGETSDPRVLAWRARVDRLRTLSALVGTPISLSAALWRVGNGDEIDQRTRNRIGLPIDFSLDDIVLTERVS